MLVRGNRWPLGWVPHAPDPGGGQHYADSGSRGDFQSIRRFADRDHANIVSWYQYGSLTKIAGTNDASGHYAAHEATEVLVSDLRQFFARR
ncbi:MAG: epoxide hydrolase [Acidimicrobiaceae bacterium]|nr:epoxide hydrolase [Acidimicrobiaceae bacterium]